MEEQRPREWALRAPAPSLVRELSGRTGLSPTLAAIMANRGISSDGEAERFLSGTIQDLSDPFLMEDLKKAASRLVDAGTRNEPVLIYADYDADGATGATCLYLFLKEAFPSLPVRIHQNHRVQEGYGLRPEQLAAAAAGGTRIVVTVDCGISDVEAIRAAEDMGIDVIVTDHHLPGSELPAAFAVLNPKRRDCRFPEKELAGVGVVFTLVRGIQRILSCCVPSGGEGDSRTRPYLDLVAVGTVADMVPMRGDNRILVKAGLEEIRTRPRLGVSALLKVAGIEPWTVNESDLGFRIGPRLNAAGRVGESRRSSDLLATSEPDLAHRLAAELNADNSRRQREEERILRSAEEALRSGQGASTPGAIVLADPEWHLGVLGIVASKLAERHFLPTVLLRVEGEDARGSCRSIEGFHLVEALAELSHLLTRFGGHSQAAGLALPVANLPLFREGLSRIAHRDARYSPRITVDAEVRLRDISTSFMEELDRIRPFGVGNEEPVLLSRGVRVLRRNLFGAGGQHLKFEVSGDGRRFEVVAFRMAGLSVEQGDCLDILFSPQRVYFRGNRSVRLLLRDVRPHRRDAGEDSPK
ncbi:MAG: single-stranded-DNA-specific exonuclease RecJ [Deltaproteobacteria bacterium]|nr:single-stranded-DNA-specific exonuclease RecJ [Deltaproteobacteria bacterium]